MLAFASLYKVFNNFGYLVDDVSNSSGHTITASISYEHFSILIKLILTSTVNKVSIKPLYYTVIYIII